MTETVEPVNKNFDLLANTTYGKTWTLKDKSSGDSLLVDASNLRMHLKPPGSAPGVSPSLALENEADSSVSGFVLDADVETNAKFFVTILAADMQALLVDDPAITFDYDFGVIDLDGVFTVYMRGQMTFRRGVTYV